jgi:hypothetical protein
MGPRTNLLVPRRVLAVGFSKIPIRFPVFAQIGLIPPYEASLWRETEKQQKSNCQDKKTRFSPSALQMLTA